MYIRRSSLIEVSNNRNPNGYEFILTSADLDSEKQRRKNLLRCDARESQSKGLEATIFLETNVTKKFKTNKKILFLIILS
jgi:hypothetical protein